MKKPQKLVSNFWGSVHAWVGVFTRKFLGARGGRATNSPKSPIYKVRYRKIATYRCSTCLEHFIAHFGVFFDRVPALKFDVGNSINVG